MILVSLYLFLSDSPSFLLALFALVVSLVSSLLLAMIVHEMGHAFVAYRLGDETAKQIGRLSPNPMRHLDPLGTLMLLMLGFGWAKPVPINLANVRSGRRGVAAVAAAGPIVNLMTAGALSVLVRTGLVSDHSTLLNRADFAWGAGQFLSEVIIIAILFNLLIATVNLLPIFPLDGSRIARSWLPIRLAHRQARLERYGPLPLIVLLALDYLAGTDLIRRGAVLVVNLLGRLTIGNEFF